MPTELPIACTLDGADLAERAASMARLGDDALVGAELVGTRATLRFSGARERVEWLVEAESRCCAFLDFEVENAGQETTLGVRAPDGAEAALREWVRAIAGEPA